MQDDARVAWELGGALTCVCGVPVLFALTGQCSSDQPASPVAPPLLAGLALVCGPPVARTWVAVVTAGLLAGHGVHLVHRARRRRRRPGPATP